MDKPRCRILVFAKAPEPGKVKTRLVPALGEGGAARLHEQLVLRALSAACEAALGPVELWCAPDAAHAFFVECARRHKVTLRTQGEGDLGARMDQALRSALRDSEHALLIGSDIPALTPAYLGEADRALADADVVVGPAQDGGYMLIGLKRPAPELFQGLSWGESSVLAATLERIERAGLRCRRLSSLRDVDRPEDLAGLPGRLRAAGGRHLQPRPRSAIDSTLHHTRRRRS